MDTSILKSDIFFVVTTVAVIVVSICIVIISFYLVRILKDLKILSQKAKDEGEQILDDVKILRKDMHKQGVKISQFFSFIASIFESRKKHPRKASKKDEGGV